MNLETINWNKDNYNEFINYLFTFKDLKYKEFHSKLILSDNLIGIRTPILKEIAKKISKGDYKTFIKLNNHKYYINKYNIYYLYCDTGDQSSEIVNRLNSFGYHTINITGGYEAYLKVFG